MRHVLFRLRSFYFLTGLSGGVFIPYLSLLMVKNGLTSAEVGQVMSLGTLIAILAQPVWGIVVDRHQWTRPALMLSSAVPAVLAVLYDSHWLWLLALASVLSSVFSAPQAPVADAHAVAAARQAKTYYGTIRCFGSLGFAVGGYFGGLFLAKFPLGAIWIPYAVLGLLGGIIALTFPQASVDAGVGGSLTDGLRELLLNRAFLAFLLGGFLVSQTLAAFNTYFSLTFRHIGGSIALTGVAFFIASSTNVPAMLIAARVIQRIGREQTMMIAALAYVMRWAIQALFPIPWVALAIQILHGVSFGFFYVAAVGYVANSTRRELQATGQSVFGMVCGGLAGIFGNLVNGYLLRLGGPELMYWVCTACSLAAAACFLYVKGHGNLKTSWPGISSNDTAASN